VFIQGPGGAAVLQPPSPLPSQTDGRRNLSFSPKLGEGDFNSQRIMLKGNFRRCLFVPGSLVHGYFVGAITRVVFADGRVLPAERSNGVGADLCK
jgi:hypothetical protein